jgi:hypothetical protein
MVLSTFVTCDHLKPCKNCKMVPGFSSFASREKKAFRTQQGLTVVHTPYHAYTGHRGELELGGVQSEQREEMDRKVVTPSVAVGECDMRPHTHQSEICTTKEAERGRRRHHHHHPSRSGGGGGGAHTRWGTLSAVG